MNRLVVGSTAFCHGGRGFRGRLSLASISPLRLGAAGLVTRNTTARPASITFYAAGMRRSLVSSQIYHRHGGRPRCSTNLAALWAAFIVFAQVFRRDDPAASGDTSRDNGAPVVVPVED